MHYISTRDSSLRFTASQTIVQGLSRDGSLFLPVSIFKLIALLEKATGIAAPAPLTGLCGKSVRFDRATEKEAMSDLVWEELF